MAEQHQVGHEFEVGQRGFVRTSISQCRGRRFVDVRLWVEPRDQPGAPLIPTRKGLAVPLEYLGYVIDYVDVRGDLPAGDLRARYAGIFTWFTDSAMPRPDRYEAWLARWPPTLSASRRATGPAPPRQPSPGPLTRPRPFTLRRRTTSVPCSPKRAS